MSQFVDGNTKSFECDEAIALHARVKLDADGKVTTAGLADKEIGTALQETFAAGEHVAVKLRTGAGTHKMLVSEAITVGSAVYTEASGKVQDTAASTSFLVGTALESSSADGDVIEVLCNSHGDTAN